SSVSQHCNPNYQGAHTSNRLEGPIIRTSRIVVKRQYTRKSVPDQPKTEKEDRKEPTELYLIIGETGIGKTTFATKLSKSHYIKTANMGPWWDDYEQQEVVILDDFYG
uniref:RNA_helicase domain-containing protein n=1 Tax=Onchocerca volvulus TaxID=6282 RepID=A0A8R1XS69_ONCVO